jgi:hypothetical protein
VWLLCCAATGGSFKAVNETFVEHWAQDEECSGNLLQLEGPDGNVRNCEGEDEVVHNLFAFPAEDNFAGRLLQGKHLLLLCYLDVAVGNAWTVRRVRSRSTLYSQVTAVLIR